MTDTAKKTEKDLIKDLADKRKLLNNFRFGIAGTKTRNVKEGRTIRKDIARIMTELNARKK